MKKYVIFIVTFILSNSVAFADSDTLSRYFKDSNVITKKQDNIIYTIKYNTDYKNYNDYYVCEVRTINFNISDNKVYQRLSGDECLLLIKDLNKFTISSVIIISVIIILIIILILFILKNNIISLFKNKTMK